MDPRLQFPWIAGSAVEPRADSAFEKTSLTAADVVRGKWPRADARDLEHALAAVQPLSVAWAGAPRASRHAHLAALVDDMAAAFEAGATWCARVQHALGLTADEARAWLATDAFRARERIEILREGEERATHGGVGVFLAHFADGCAGLLARVAQRLLSGSGAVVVVDACLPEAGDALVEALSRSEARAALPLAVLYDDGRSVALAACTRRGLDWLRARGTREELAPLLERRPGAHAEFGAGLCEWSVWIDTSRVHVVSARAEAALEAQRVIDEGLDPAGTLFGQMPNSIARVLCPARSLSRFTEELLARLDHRPDLSRALPLISPNSFEALREAWSLGLDEGAAPIFGEAPGSSTRRGEERGLDREGEAGVASSAAAQAPTADAPRAGRRARPAKLAYASVFTNVEAEGRLLRLEAPAPLLRLVRVPNENDARELECRLRNAPSG